MPQFHGLSWLANESTNLSIDQKIIIHWKAQFDYETGDEASDDNNCFLHSIDIQAFGTNCHVSLIRFAEDEPSMVRNVQDMFKSIK